MKRGLGLGLMACVVVLTACGQRANGSGPVPADTTPTATTADTTTAAHPAGAPGGAPPGHAMPPDVPATAPTADARAKAAATDFSAQLKSALMARLQAGGPAEAVDFCHAQAPRIAAQVAKAHGVHLGRLAVPGRNRNPTQDPTGWQLDAAKAFQQAVDAGGNPADQVRLLTTGLPDGVAARFAKGIAVEPPCLACHGRQIAPRVREVLARHYPGDRATGFDVGDLRGLLWVEVPAGANAAPYPNTAKENRP